MRESGSDPHWLMEAPPQGNAIKIAILSHIFLLLSHLSPFSSLSYLIPNFNWAIIAILPQENDEHSNYLDNL